MTQRWRALSTRALASGIVLLGLWDQLPSPLSRATLAADRAIVLADHHLTSVMEEKLPSHAMIFELPVWNYPEIPPVQHMQDYEHFRPYLASRGLRFSYGSNKGRTRERWQTEAEQLAPKDLVSTLENYGFSAILINKKAYSDQGAMLMAGLQSTGMVQMLADSADLVCVSLHPARHPVLPPDFDNNWYGFEGNMNQNLRWSKGDAKVTLYNLDSKPKTEHLSFTLSSLQPRVVEISQGCKTFYSSHLGSGPAASIELELQLLPGPNDIQFRTDTPSKLPGNGDVRLLAFSVGNFSIKE